MRVPIDELRQKYGQVYVTRIGDVEFVWHPLTRPEWDGVMARATDGGTLDELLCQEAVVWPDGLDFGADEAGWPGELAPQIRELSGFGTPETSVELLEAYRAEMNMDWAAQAEVTIRAAFPDVTFEQMRQWTMAKLLWFLSRAEWKLRNIDGRPIAFEVKRPSESEQQEPREAAMAMRMNGVDPMLTIDPKNLAEPYMPTLLIGGTRWHNEVVWDELHKQISRPPER